jgi:hypothetical protein
MSSLCRARILILLPLVGALFAAPSAWGDSKAECVTASEQGQQLRDDGKYLRAREQFQACSRATCPRVVSSLCTQWAHELDENTPTIVVGAKDAQGGDVVDAHATLDGAPLVDRLDGKPVPVDPGPHVLQVTREGSAPAEQKIVVRAGERSRVITLTLGVAPAASTGGSGGPRAAEPGAEAGVRASSGIGRGLTTGSLGVLAAAAIGSGVYLGLHSTSLAGSAGALRGSIPSDACTSTTSQVCQNLSGAVDAENRDAVLARVFYVSGAVLAVGAAAAWFFWPRPKASESAAARVWLAPSGSAQGGTVGLGGRF